MPYPESETLHSAVKKARFGSRRMLALLSMVEQAASSAWWTLEELPAAVRMRSSMGSICVSVTEASGTSTQAFG